MQSEAHPGVDHELGRGEPFRGVAAKERCDERFGFGRDALPFVLVEGDLARPHVAQHLMREAISGHQKPSEAIRGHQRSSEVISAHQRSSVIISDHQ
jgi:hypothetical protein